MNDAVLIISLVALAVFGLAVVYLYISLDEMRDKANNNLRFVDRRFDYFDERWVKNTMSIVSLAKRIDALEQKAFVKTPGGEIREENPKAPVKHTFYPCCVFHSGEEFYWYHTKPWALIHGEKYPKDKENVEITTNCTVEVLEYPDGRYSAAWFPGEFREEEA